VGIGTLAQFDKIMIGLEVIKLFLKMSNDLEIVCLKCQILENCKGKKKMQKMVENPKHEKELVLKQKTCITVLV
jgi:hypothetical protein